VAQLLSDHPRLQLQYVEHVAGAEVPQLVEVEPVLGVDGQALHADHRAIENFLAVSEPDGTTRFLIAAERRLHVTDATLATFAGETRDIANVIAHEHGLTIPHLAELDAAIAEHFPYADRGAATEDPS
jgi:hypothetical protein